MGNKGRNLLSIPDFMVTLMAVRVKEGQSLSDLHYSTLITYSHLHLIVGAMKDEGWVYTKKKGRELHIYLTDNGLVITSCLEGMFKVMNIDIFHLDELKRKKNGKNVLWTQQQSEDK